MANVPFNPQELLKEKPPGVSQDVWTAAIASAGRQPNMEALIRTATVIAEDRQRAINSQQNQAVHFSIQGQQEQKEKEKGCIMVGGRTVVGHFIQNMISIAGLYGTTVEHLVATIKSADKTAKQMFGDTPLAKHMSTTAVAGAMVASKLAGNDKHLNEHAQLELQMLKRDSGARNKIDQEQTAINHLIAHPPSGMSPDRLGEEIDNKRREIGRTNYDMIQKHSGDSDENAKYATIINNGIDKIDKDDPRFKDMESLAENIRRRETYAEMHKDAEKPEGIFEKSFKEAYHTSIGAVTDLAASGQLGPIPALGNMVTRMGVSICGSMGGVIYKSLMGGDGDKPLANGALKSTANKSLAPTS